MVVTGLGGIASFSVGLGVKNSYRTWGYIRIAGTGLGLFKISWGKNLKGTVIFGQLALLMLLSSGCLRLCCMDPKSALIPKLMQDNHTISMEQINNNRTKDKPQESTLKGCLESIPSKTGVGTSVKETHVFNNTQKLSYNNQKKCLNN